MAIHQLAIWHGIETKNPNDFINIFYLQYSENKYDITLGNLYLLYGRGLSMHTYEDQNIDYDNSIKGIDFIYHLNDRIDLFSFIGTSDVKSRVNIANRAKKNVINKFMAKNNQNIFESICKNLA